MTYPGGSFINDIVSMQSSTGRSHDYMASLVAIAPQVTVTEIQQRFRTEVARPETLLAKANERREFLQTFVDGDLHRVWAV